MSLASKRERPQGWMPGPLTLPLAPHFACSMHLGGDGGGKIKLASCINTAEAPHG